MYNQLKHFKTLKSQSVAKVGHSGLVSVDWSVWELKIDNFFLILRYF